MTNLPAPPFRPGFPGDWPIRPGNEYHFDWRATTRNKIGLWMPENGGSKSFGKLLQLCHEEASFRFWKTGECAWAHSFEKPGLLRIDGRVEGIEDGVEMHLTLTNLTDRDWEAVGAGVCVQMQGAPDFRDPERSRTFYPTADGLRTMEGPTFESGGGMCLFYASGRDGRPPATASFICVEAVDGKHTIGTWWEGAQGCGGNCHPSTQCIHSNPGFGNIAAGQSVTRRGRLYMMPGPAIDAYRRFLKEQTSPPSRP